MSHGPYLLNSYKNLQMNNKLNFINLKLQKKTEI